MASVQTHHVVVVDSWVDPPDLSFEHKATKYSNTTSDELPERIKDATIVITSATRITRAGLESATKLQLISCNGTGTDHVDKDAVRDHGLSVCRVPAQNTDSVSEHAFAQYFAIRRRVIEMHEVAMDGKTWTANLGRHVPDAFGKPGPRVNAEETLVVVGYGAIGRRIEQIGKALGMNVLISERKGVSNPRNGRVSFQGALQQGTIFMVATPLDKDTRNMFSEAEFAAMDPSAFIVNVGRGGVINEAALAKALRDRQIGGAATDVFEHEPATVDNCPLLDPSIPNLLLSPHAAWYSARTIKGTIATVKANIEGFVDGRPQNMVILAGEDCV